jgi:serine phosphatase RsbU (regulator of sigma subunit)/putative methionine-R-sulfoxide reductase with GAF domain
LIVYEAGSGESSPHSAARSISLDDPTGVLPRSARLGETILLNNGSNGAEVESRTHPPHGTRSELCLPLIFDGQVMGLLDIHSERANTFTQDDQIMFEAVAGSMASAIRNADLFRSEQWRRRTADSVRDVAGLLSTNADVDQVLETILTELDRILPVDVSAIWLLEDGDLCLAAVHGADPDQLESVCLTDPASSYAMAEALLTEIPIIRRPDDPMWPAALAEGYESNYSSIAAPLRVGDRPLGVLTLEHHTSGRYGHEAQAITTTFAGYAAVSIENARLYDAAQEQAYASAALLQVAQAVVSLNDLDEILGAIVRTMPILVGLRRTALLRWDAERNTFCASHEFGFSREEESILTEVEFGIGDFPLLDAAREEHRLLLHELEKDAPPASWLEIEPQVAGEADPARAERLLMAVPLTIKNDLFGVLLVEEAQGARRFRSRRLEIITGIAQQAALAIQNDLLQQEMVGRERLETEIQLARQIQQTFIPQGLPSHPAWQFAARWRTARQVGGDFYDVIELPQGRLGLFIADVADKGMPAALFMALTRTLVRAAVTGSESPASALQRVNDQLLPDTHQGMFVTAVYGILDLERGEFSYVNAGHNPPLWVKADGTVERLTRTGMALGVMEQPSMSARSISLGAGDLLLLYTDGVTDSFSPEGGLFGESRLIETVRPIRDQGTEEVLDAVEKRLNEFSDPLPPADDLTMMAVKRLKG